MNADAHVERLRELTSLMQRAHDDAARYYTFARQARTDAAAREWRNRMHQANREAASLYRQRREAMIDAHQDHVSDAQIGRACRLTPQAVAYCVTGWHLDKVNFDAWRQEREAVAREAESDADGQGDTQPSSPCLSLP